MYLRFLKPLLYVILLVVIQLVVVPLISVDGIAPNLPLIVIIYYTLIYGQLFGTLFGFISGLIFDLASGGLLGASMFSYTISAFLCGYFANDNKVDQNTRSYIFAVIVFVGSVINCFIYSAISISVREVGFLFLFFNTGIFPAVYTALFSFTIFLFKPKRGLL